MKPQLYDTETMYSVLRDGAWTRSKIRHAKIKAFDKANANQRARNRLYLMLLHAGTITRAEDLRVMSVHVTAAVKEGAARV
jgi:hypothetical protein